MNGFDEELFVAAEENNVPEVRRLLSVGADVNASDDYGWTPLHGACSNVHLPVVKELMEYGADIEATTRFGDTPLHISTIHGHVAVVIELLGHGAEIQSIDTNGPSTSILGKRKSRAANIEAKNEYGNTPLHFASERNHLAVVKALLSGGADMLAVNNYGELPIHLAVKRGNSEVSKYLLQEFYGKIRRLPLHELLEDLTCIVNPNSSGVPPLRAALRQNLLGTDDVVEILEYLVDKNPALLSSRNQDGSLPLHVAIRRGASFYIVQSLVKHHQASVKSVTPQGDLPLFLACDVPEPSLDTIFLLMKLYPDLVYHQ
jgi:ankyrin repeat protein